MIGDRLKALRKQAEMSVKKLSELSEVPISTIDKIEANQTKSPSFQTVVDLCTALGVTVDALLYPEAGKKEQFIHPSQHPLSDRMIEQYERLLSEQQSHYEHVIAEKERQIHDKSIALSYNRKWTTILSILLFIVIIFLIGWLILDLIVPAIGWFK